VQLFDGEGVGKFLGTLPVADFGEGVVQGTVGDPLLAEAAEAFPL